MAFDFKKEYKVLYLPPVKPTLVDVPPLEGLWWSEKGEVNYAHKEDFHFISMIRLPEFVAKADFDRAVEEATRKTAADNLKTVIRYPVK